MISSSDHMDRFPNVILKTVWDGYMELSDRNGVFWGCQPLVRARTGGAEVSVWWFSCQEKKRRNNNLWNGPDLNPTKLSVSLSGTSLKIVFRLPISDKTKVNMHWWHGAAEEACRGLRLNCPVFNFDLSVWNAFSFLWQMLRKVFLRVVLTCFLWTRASLRNSANVLDWIYCARVNLEKDPKRLANMCFILHVKILIWKYKCWHLSLKGQAINYKTSTKVTFLTFYCIVLFIYFFIIILSDDVSVSKIRRCIVDLKGGKGKCFLLGNPVRWINDTDDFTNLCPLIAVMKHNTDAVHSAP